jgi:hypothetical protein
MEKKKINRWSHTFVPDHQIENEYTAPWNVATILNLRRISAEQVVYTVFKHLLTQGERAVNRDGVCMACMYRTPDGLKCAAGVLIPDYLVSLILNEDNNESSWEDVRQSVGDDYYDYFVHTRLIHWLQEIHDNDSNWGSNVFRWDPRFPNPTLNFFKKVSINPKVLKCFPTLA